MLSLYQWKWGDYMGREDLILLEETESNGKKLDRIIELLTKEGNKMEVKKNGTTTTGKTKDRGNMGKNIKK